MHLNINSVMVCNAVLITAARLSSRISLVHETCIAVSASLRIFELYFVPTLSSFLIDEALSDGLGS